MTTLDPDRVTFVRNEYRTFSATDNSVSALYPGARVINITTNLNRGDAQALADKTLAATKMPTNAIEVTYDGTLNLDSMVGQNPTVLPNFPRLAIPVKTMRVYSVLTDYDANTTTVQARG